MARLNVYHDIVDNDCKVYLQWQGLDGIAWADVDKFVASIPKDDDKIHLQINCRGGMTREALAIYDSLRASGKEISAEVIGECSSSATLLLCAAKKELRVAHPHATLLIHNPYVSGNVQGDAADFQRIADDLTAERNKFLDIYVERTGADRETLAAMMDADKEMSVAKAIELGFIDHELMPMSAQRTTNITKTKTMNKSKIWSILGKALGIYGMTINTADGGTLELRKDEGDIAVGDEVTSDDGIYTLPDGTEVVVEDGAVKEINAPSETTEEEVTKEAETAEAAQEEITTTEETTTTETDNTEVDELKAKIAELEAENERLKAELEAALGNAKTDEDKETLDAVAVAGGKEWLAKAATDYKVGATDFSATADVESKHISYREFYNIKHKK